MDRNEAAATQAASAPSQSTVSTGRLKRILKRTAMVVGALLLVLIAALGGGGIWLHHQIKASLPKLDGELAIRGLTAPVTVERDELGIPTLHASNRLDLALATGFVHAQDRFFQMDLLRRQAAGELAELFGSVALAEDRRLRVHCFRHRAIRALEDSSAFGRQVLEAYAQGVNAGLAFLESKPFEYLALRTDPAPWLPEDTILVLLSMFIELHDEDGRIESLLGVMHDILPEPLFEFLTPQGTEWDAPLAGEPFSTPPIPGPDVVDIRSMDPWAGLRSESQARIPEQAQSAAYGSNNWAVAGQHTAHGGALLSNDMHLDLGLPNIWYRASFVWREEGSEEEHRITGVTLPGTPAMVVGSNTHVAWGFTNSYGDWSDLVIVDLDPDDLDVYLTADGPRELESHEEAIRVNTCADKFWCDGVVEEEPLEVVSTIWGPVVDEDHRGRPRAIRWVAHDAQAVSLGQIHLEKARDIEEAIELANRSGIPAQNFVVADRDGRVGWTIMGIIPRRIGYEGRLPASWADGTRRWDGWLAPTEYPRILDPESGRLWTANARVVGGEMLKKIGDGSYVLGARAGQIRDGLVALDQASERDMLEIQLDDRALFLERWRTVLLDILSPEVLDADPRREELRRLVEQNWTGRASVDSVGFRMVRGFRLFLRELVFNAITAPCKEADPEFDYLRYRQSEGPLWKLLTERPLHLLDPQYDTWEEQLLAAVDHTLNYYLTEEGSTLAQKTWGELNTVRIGHPLSRAVPQLSRWLDMPAQPLPGASHTPRAQRINFGASQRMVVSPGREEEGIFHMPGGQSGHPLSPHYSDGHQAWVNGEPTPLLPGPAVHTLHLSPDRSPGIHATMGRVLEPSSP